MIYKFLEFGEIPTFAFDLDSSYQFWVSRLNSKFLYQCYRYSESFPGESLQCRAHLVNSRVD